MRPFTKLEGLGNDFVLFDHRDGRPDPEARIIRALADRRTGVGFDQLLVLHPAESASADCGIHIFNRDGSPALQCGNGMRAVARWMSEDQPGRKRFVLDTPAGSVGVEDLGHDQVRVDMGCPAFGPDVVALDNNSGLDALLGDIPGLRDSGLVSMGNPHLVLVVQEPANKSLVDQHGARLGAHSGFREGVNVGFAAIDPDGSVVLRVYERGVGQTPACGSAACAVAAWLIDQNRTAPPVRVVQPGGTLVIDWPGDCSSLWMTGPARRIFDGMLPT